MLKLKLQASVWQIYMALQNGYAYEDSRRWMFPSAVNTDNHHMQTYYPYRSSDRRDDGFSDYHLHLNNRYPNSLPRYCIPAGASSSFPVYRTAMIGEHDVLCGRGGATNSHRGNQAYRRLVQAHKNEYLQAKKKYKPVIAARVVKAVREKGGHFLKQEGNVLDGTQLYWVDVGDEKAMEKTCQALREGAPALLRQGCFPKDDTIKEESVDDDDNKDDAEPSTMSPSKTITTFELKPPNCEHATISTTDTSSWESSSCSIQDSNFLRPYQRMVLPLGWDCEPIPLHHLPPTERELYLRAFVPPLPTVNKKPRLHPKIIVAEPIDHRINRSDVFE